MSDLIKREDAIEALKGREGILHDTYTAVAIIRSVPSADRPQDDDWEKYSDKLWKNAYERGKEEEHRWWSEHCAKCTDADRPQGEWIEKAISIIDDMQSEGIVDYEQAREFRMRARMKGADDE